jgi:glutathione S-transferase
MSSSPDYTPPKVWTWNKANGGQFANINRRSPGRRTTRICGAGRYPLQLYSMGTPNGVKVTVMLEELLVLGHTGAEYDACLIKIGDGDLFGSGFVTINPNSKIPALLDRSGPMPIRVFESGAILLYLAEKFGAFLPTDTGARAECLSWLLLTRCDYFNGYPAVALAPSLSRSEHPHLEGIQAERQPPTAGVVDRAIGKRSHFPYLRDRQGPPRPVRHVI